MALQVREFREVITADGQHFVFTNGEDRYTVFLQGMGIPPIVRGVERGYDQDGVTVIEKHLDERTILVQFLGQACSRQDYDRLRDAIIDAMRPNRGEPLTLRVRRTDGDFFEIDVEAEGEVLGEEMPAIDNLVDTTFVLKAAEPAWRRIPASVSAAQLRARRHLVYPFVYPSRALYNATTITFQLAAVIYEGSYESYPTITILGPATSLFVRNETLGVDATFTFDIPAGVTVTIQFTQEGPIVTSSEGADYGGFLTSDSEPLGFLFAPEGVDVPGGVNTITITVGGATEDTRLTFTYYTMEIGI